MSQAAPAGPGLLGLVREGMAVQDDTGRRLGRVTRVRMGESEARSTEGSVANHAHGGAAVVSMQQAEGVPDSLDNTPLDLRRVGFIELDQPPSVGVAGRYVRGDQVIDVTQEGVRIRADASAGRTGSPAEPTGLSSPPVVLRTTLGTPEVETSIPQVSPPDSPRNGPRPIVLAAATGAVVVVAVASLAGVLYWRRRERERRAGSRLRRATEAVLRDLSRASAEGSSRGWVK